MREQVTSEEKKNTWICCQIGAREHYAIPRALQSANKLQLLITDYWTRHGTFINSTITKNLKGRRHRDLPNEKVKGFNLSSISFEIYNKISRARGWHMVMERNQWFQRKTIETLKYLPANDTTHMFSYSYAAKDIFKYAKSRGWKTVLGQIDPGPLEEEIVASELTAYPEYESEWQPAPKSYWENWYQECELADEIIVNSDWSFEALIHKRIDKAKIRIMPLTYSIPEFAMSFERKYPFQFDRTRPLRILFLGQVILRKGIARIIEAAKLLVDQPVEFIIAGPAGIHPLPLLPNVKWVGRVPRIEVNRYFKNADVFLLPTLSDGFGLTQLEARAWKLPLIVSKNCGTVVKNQFDGWVLEDVTPKSIENIICTILQSPEILSTYSTNISSSSHVDSIFNLLLES